MNHSLNRSDALAESDEALWPEENQFKFTVVIPACNEAMNLFELIPQILAENSECEILVCDNNSRDDDTTKELVEGFTSRFPNVRYLDANPPLQADGTKPPFKFGAPDARNFGAARAKGEYIFFLDADTRFGKDFFRKSLEHMKYRSLNAAGFDYEPNTRKDAPKLAKAADMFMVASMNGLQNLVVNTPLSLCLGAAMVVERAFQKKKEMQFRSQVCEDVIWARTASKKGKFGIIDISGVQVSMRRMEGKRLALARLYFKNAVAMVTGDVPNKAMNELYMVDPDGKPYRN